MAEAFDSVKTMSDEHTVAVVPAAVVAVPVAEAIAATLAEERPCHGHGNLGCAAVNHV